MLTVHQVTKLLKVRIIWLTEIKKHEEKVEEWVRRKLSMNRKWKTSSWINWKGEIGEVEKDKEILWEIESGYGSMVRKRVFGNVIQTKDRDRAIEEMQEAEDKQEERAEKVNLRGKKEINTMEEK